LNCGLNLRLELVAMVSILSHQEACLRTLVHPSIVHNTLWIETGTFNMREHTAVN